MFIKVDTNKRVFVTSDTHFGHKKLQLSWRRYYNSIKEMDFDILSKWNKVVNPDDVVFHLWDVCYGTPTIDLNQLNGIKYLILGNHDYYRMDKLGYQKIFTNIAHSCELSYNKETYIVNHYPLVTWNREIYGTKHLYGY